MIRRPAAWWVRPYGDRPPRIADLSLDIARSWHWTDDAARWAQRPIDVPDFKKRITWSLQLDGYPRWLDIDEIRRRITGIVQRIRLVLQAGHPAQAFALAAHAVIRLDEAIERWRLGAAVETQCRSLERLHFDACRAARPEPGKFGWRLAKLAIETHRGWFPDGAVVYAEMLGEVGLAAYRRRVDRDWGTLPPLAPGDQPWREQSYRHRLRVAGARESLAVAVGDTDELVRVLAHDRSHAGAYLKIADALERAERQREALTWLERGYGAFPAEDRGGLPAALAAAYRRDGLEDDAARVIANRAPDK